MGNTVGIVTSLDWQNFGTLLQAFALQRKLHELGCDARLIAKKYGADDIPSYIISLGTMIGVYQLWECVKNRERPYPKVSHWIRQNLRLFNLWLPCQLKHLNKKTDCFVSGSDQIWNSFGGYSPWNFLTFARDGIRKVSYATSLGTRGVNPKYVNDVRGYINRFDRISVREAAGVRVLSELTGRTDIVQMPDPVFLFTKNEWIQLIAGARSSHLPAEPYLLCYLLKDQRSYDDQINEIARRIGVKSIVLVEANDNKGLKVRGADLYAGVDPFEFLRLLQNASYVCTNSFHGTVFSIIFEKMFTEFMRFPDLDETSQNVRVYEVLDMLGLRNRVFEHVHWDEKIDYAQIRAIVSRRRDTAIAFLRENICIAT